VHIVAHRGVTDKAPENTMPAFERALDLGADAIECDVRLTRDGVPVIANPVSFAGAAALRGPISAYTLDELRGDALYEMPTLTDVLDRFAGHIGLEIHVKVGEMQSVAVVAATLQPYQRHWESIEVTSYEATDLREIGKRCPRLATDLLLPRTEPRMSPMDIAFLAIHRAHEVTAETKRVRAVHLHPTQLLPETVAAIRAAGFDVQAWDVNDRAALDTVSALGILRICTDRLVEALDYRHRHGILDS